MSNKSKDYSFFSPLDYEKYSNLHIVFESRSSKDPYFIDKKINPDFFGKKKNIEQRPKQKPNGLWFSCGVDWFNWCMNEFPNWVTGKNFYSLILNEDKILHIKTLKELKEFNKNYGITEFDINLKTKKKIYFTYIKYNKIPKKYSGIKFCPYLKYKLNKISKNPIAEFNWYYSLDAASGCIWNPDCIEKVVYGGYLPKYDGNEKKIKEKFEKILMKLNKK